MISPPPLPAPGSPLPPSEGVFWVKAALRFFRTEPVRWLGITAAFFILMQLFGLIPAGVIVAFLLKPVLTVGFLAAAWHQERAVRPQITHLFFGFKSNWKALLPLGVVYLLGLAIAVTLATAVSGVALDQLVTSPDMKVTPEMLAKLRIAMLWAILFMLPVTLALWFAPALIVFDDVSFVTALKLSLAACARSLGAIVVYAIALFGLATALSFAVLLLQAISPTFGRVALFMLVLPVTALVFIADYVSYRRVFHGNLPLRVP